MPLSHATTVPIVLRNHESRLGLLQWLIFSAYLSNLSSISCWVECILAFQSNTDKYILLTTLISPTEWYPWFHQISYQQLHVLMPIGHIIMVAYAATCQHLVAHPPTITWHTSVILMLHNLICQHLHPWDGNQCLLSTRMPTVML